MSAYYNEIDEYAARWLRNLMKEGHIADGVVDTRSIVAVEAADLRDFDQCHFFASIGVWSHALRLAGWPDDRPVWTGSCPCQPFSAAGKGKDFEDERHLWPEFHRLIRECQPGVVFGEQVASKDGLAWLDLVHSDLEGTGYAVGAVDICAAGVGAPHIRQRLYWLADASGIERQRVSNIGPAGLRGEDVSQAERGNGLGDLRAISGRLGDDDDARLEGQRGGYQTEGGRIRTVRSVAASGELGGVGYAGNTAGERDARSVLRTETKEHGARLAINGSEPVRPEYASPSMGGMADAELQQRSGSEASCDDTGGRQQEPTTAAGFCGDSGPGPTNGLWRDADWLYCRDGKWRPVEPGTFPLAHGAPARVGRLRAYGNAIVAQAAAEVISAFMECRP